MINGPLDGRDLGVNVVDVRGGNSEELVQDVRLVDRGETLEKNGRLIKVGLGEPEGRDVERVTGGECGPEALGLGDVPELLDNLSHLLGRRQPVLIDRLPGAPVRVMAWIQVQVVSLGGREENLVERKKKRKKILVCFPLGFLFLFRSFLPARPPHGRR